MKHYIRDSITCQTPKPKNYFHQDKRKNTGCILPKDGDINLSNM